MPVEVFARTPGQNAKIEQRIVRAVEIIVLKVWGDRLLLLAILSAGKPQWLDRFQRNVKDSLHIPPSATAGLRDMGEALFVDFACRYTRGSITLDGRLYALSHLDEIGVQARRELDLEIEAGHLNADAKRKKRMAVLEGWQSLSTGHRRGN